MYSQTTLQPDKLNNFPHNKNVQHIYIQNTFDTCARMLYLGNFTSFDILLTAGLALNFPVQHLSS